MRGSSSNHKRVGWGAGTIVLIVVAMFIASPPVHAAQCDVNHDGVINACDVLWVLNAWVANDPAADVNRDGHVDARDLFMVMFDVRSSRVRQEEINKPQQRVYLRAP